MTGLKTPYFINEKLTAVFWARFFGGLFRQYPGDIVGKGVFEGRNLSLYSYAAQNPLIYVDPDGRAAGFVNEYILEIPGAILLVGVNGTHNISMGSSYQYSVGVSKFFGSRYGKTGNRERIVNAARHAAWLAKLTQLYGEKTARRLAKLHELGEESSQDSKIDQYNNEIGIKIGLKAKDDTEIMLMIDESLSNGDLIADWAEDNPNNNAINKGVDPSLPKFIGADSSQVGSKDSTDSVHTKGKSPEYVEQ